MTDFLKAFVRAVDGFNEVVGRLTAWLTLGCVAVCFVVVVMRYAAGVGFVWMQESYVWMHALIFLVGAGFTFKAGDHVSVDILYTRFSARTQAWVDIIGTLVFMAPWLVVIALYSAPFILNAWAIHEPSAQANGLPGVFLLKTALWAFCAVVGLQGLALIVRRALFLSGHETEIPAHHHHVVPDGFEGEGPRS